MLKEVPAFQELITAKVMKANKKTLQVRHLE